MEQKQINSQKFPLSLTLRKNKFKKSDENIHTQNIIDEQGGQNEDLSICSSEA